MTFYGSYSRSVKQDGDLVELRIRRVICSECGSTHALLLSEIVPYSRTLLEDQADIISGSPAAVMERNPMIDESCIRSILRQFKKHWEQVLLAAGIPFHPLRSLVETCFSFRDRQFMQIKKDPQHPFFETNITLHDMPRLLLYTIKKQEQEAFMTMDKERKQDIALMRDGTEIQA